MKMKRILVTGGAGFIGSHVVDKFIELGHDVVVIDNLSSGKKANLNPKATFYDMDVQDEAVREIFSRHRFDVVDHHAAQIDVRKSVEDPVFDARTNVLGLLNILQNSVKHGVKKVIFISSGGVVYGDPEKLPPNEDYPFAPESPYGVTKTVGEYYLRYYAKTHNLKFTALRYSNVYGPRQNPEGEAGVVAIFSQLMLKGKECSIFGDGKQTRDYVSVLDVARANAACLDKGDNESINIGTGRETSVNQLFSLLSRITGYDKKPVYLPPRKGELARNFLDVGKAKNILGWVPGMTLEEGLKKTVDWISSLR